MLIGVLNGVLIAYVEIPAIFATLAMGTVVYGFGASFLVDTTSTSCRSAGWFWAIGGGDVLGVPSPVICLRDRGVASPTCSCATPSPAAIIYAMGDNPHGGARGRHPVAADDGAAVHARVRGRASSPASSWRPLSTA